MNLNKDNPKVPVTKNNSYTVKITSFNDDGEGVARIDGFTCFIPDLLPDEEAEITILEVKKNFARAKYTKILKESEKRVIPQCPYSKDCGGCQLQHLNYETQLEFKKNKVQNSFSRIAKIIEPNIDDCSPSPIKEYYRNKIELQLFVHKNGISLGFHKKGSHYVIDINECQNFNKLGNQVIKEIRNFLGTIDFNLQKQIKSISIKTDAKLNNSMLVFNTIKNSKVLCDKIIEGLSENKKISSAYYKTPRAQKSELIFGERFIYDIQKDLSFCIGPDSFHQINPLVAQKVYDKAKSLLSKLNNQNLIDAFAGTGTIGIWMADLFEEIILVEENKESCKLAKHNLKQNDIKNAKVIMHDLETGYNFTSSTKKLIIDPPRNGCSEKFLNKIANSNIEEIIYISCKPSTLARDISRLSPFGYNTEKAFPFDMFPNTSHVEVVVKLTRF